MTIVANVEMLKIPLTNSDNTGDTNSLEVATIDCRAIVIRRSL